MVEIECLACTKTIKIPKFIDIDKYEGQLACKECNSLLYVKLVQGKVQKYRVVENKRERDIKIEYKLANSRIDEDEKSS